MTAVPAEASQQDFVIASNFNKQITAIYINRIKLHLPCPHSLPCLLVNQHSHTKHTFFSEDCNSNGS